LEELMTTALASETTVKPTTDNILARRLKPAAMMTESGIHLPEQSIPMDPRALVLAVGPQVAQATEGFREGDIILVGTYGGQHVELEGNEYIMLKAEDVLATVDGPLPKEVE
jgi:chaperonin GroES